MSTKPIVDGAYLIYKNKPLVRKDNFIIYGDMTDSYFLKLIILSNKTDELGNEVPENILIQVIKSDTKSIEKQEFKQGLYESLDLGSIWLSRYINE